MNRDAVGQYRLRYLAVNVKKSIAWITGSVAKWMEHTVGYLSAVYATEAVDLSLIPSQVKPKAIKIGIYGFLFSDLYRSAIEGSV